MQAVCKAVRKQSLCGSKPGGAAAYDLRESCVKKDRTAAKAAQRASNTAKAKILSLAEFYMKEIKKLADRKADMKDLSHDLPAHFVAGLDHRMVEIYINDAKKSQDLTVRTRIKKACDEINKGRRTQTPVEFTRGLEMLVIVGATAHYSRAMKDVTD
jgi:hypothetical protein